MRLYENARVVEKPSYNNENMLWYNELVVNF